MNRRLIAYAGAWMLLCTSPAPAPPIEGYTDQMSYAPGDTVLFHVSSYYSPFSLEITRIDSDTDVLVTIENIPVENHSATWNAENALYRGANWPVTFAWTVPENFPSGSYYARFIALDNADEAYRPFVIRETVPGARSRVAVVANYVTSVAYNYWGGSSFYSEGVHPNGPAREVSMLRPFARGDGKGLDFGPHEVLVSFLEGEGFILEYITEQDIHCRPGILGAYDVLILGGHHEYISREVFDAFEAHHQRGGHLAIFSANDFYWQARYEDDCQMLVCYKSFALSEDPMLGVDDSLVTTLWRRPPLNRPPEAFKGTKYVAGSSSPDFERIDVTVQLPDHWIFAGIDLSEGDPFGYQMAFTEMDWLGPASPPVVDVLLYARRVYTGDDPNLPPFIDVGSTYLEDSPAYGRPDGNGGMLFSAGMVAQWCTQLLPTRPEHEQVRQATRNIINGMLAAPRDCNTNGFEDAAEIAACPSGDRACADCNANGRPDACDLQLCPSGVPGCRDCNANGVPDACDLAVCVPGDFACSDCNANGVPDGCDLAACAPGEAWCDDCDGNSVPDGCDPDCDGDLRPDACALADCVPGDLACGDCDTNGVPDGCDADCDDDGVPDACAIAACLPDHLACGDCNANDVPDGCEDDFDGDGVIDPCDTDRDADGVFDLLDLCDATPPGVAIRSDGSALADINLDCHTDLADYAAFQRCFSGVGVTASHDCSRARLDQDNDVDLDDLAILVNAWDE